MTEEDNWISHDGTGDPDFPGETKVAVKFRDGEVAVGIVHDWDQNWQWANSEAGLTAAGAIVAFKPV
jgi:hypothetical protein